MIRRCSANLWLYGFAQTLIWIVDIVALSARSGTAAGHGVGFAEDIAADDQVHTKGCGDLGDVVFAGYVKGLVRERGRVAIHSVPG